MSYEFIEMSRIKKIENLKEKKQAKQISVIVPTYNEAKNIKKFVKRIKDNLNGIDYEIIIVDDDSQDGTREIIIGLTQDKRVFALIRKNKKGLFSAIEDGIKIAKGEYIQTIDSDFSHPPEKIKDFWKFKDKFDIVSGSRYIKGGGVDSSFFRKYGSMILNKICSKIMRLGVMDVGGNFHLMKKKKFEELKIRLPSIFGEFSFEWFYNAKKKGFSIKEIPFIYKFREEGESKMGGNKDFLKLLKTALLYIKRAFVLRIYY